MQLLALVMAAAMGCLISCAIDAAISPNVLTRLMCARPLTRERDTDAAESDYWANTWRRTKGPPIE
jgi:hypothetical protein